MVRIWCAHATTPTGLVQGYGARAQKTAEIRRFFAGIEVAISISTDLAMAHIMTPLNIYIVDKAMADAGLASDVQALGHRVIDGASCSAAGLCADVGRKKPDLVMVHVPAVDHECLSAIGAVAALQQCATLVFVRNAGDAAIEACIKSGVSAVVVDGLQRARLPALIAIARARFVENTAVHTEMRRLLNSLEERKLIERAKGILMRRRNIEENAAHQALRKMAMDRGKRMHDVAQTIVNAEELLAQR